MKYILEFGWIEAFFAQFAPLLTGKWQRIGLWCIRYLYMGSWTMIDFWPVMKEMQTRTWSWSLNTFLKFQDNY